MSNIENLTAAIREFAQQRHWERFHTPKNLAMALSVEVAEVAALVELFQWLTLEESAAPVDTPGVLSPSRTRLPTSPLPLRPAYAVGVTNNEAILTNLDFEQRRFRPPIGESNRSRLKRRTLGDSDLWDAERGDERISLWCRHLAVYRLVDRLVPAGRSRTCRARLSRQRPRLP